MSYPPQNQHYYSQGPPPPPQQPGYPGPQYHAPPPGPPPNAQGWGAPNYQQPQQGHPGYPPSPYNAQQQYPPPGPGYPGHPGQAPPSPAGYPPPGHPPPGPQQYAPPQGPPQQPYGYPGSYQQPHSSQPPQNSQSYPAPQQQYGTNPGQGYMQQPPQPSPGYGPNDHAHGDFRREADALRKAMKGFGTDEKTLISVLAKLDPKQINAVRATYKSHIRRDLYEDVKSETSGYFKQGLLAIIDGPLLHDTALAREAIQGIGTKEWLLDDVLVGRSNLDLNAIKACYNHTYRRSLERDVEGDLSFKTKTFYSHVLSASRTEESPQVNLPLMEGHATSIHDATTARVMNNADQVSSILPHLSNYEIRAVNDKFNARYRTSLEKHIEKELSGHMKDALLHLIRGALDPAGRDAVALEECMKGMGTKDEKLVIRVVRLHWDRNHLENVKRAYQAKYKTDLVKRVKGETSGDYQRLLVAMLE